MARHFAGVLGIWGLRFSFTSGIFTEKPLNYNLNCITYSKPHFNSSLGQFTQCQWGLSTTHVFQKNPPHILIKIEQHVLNNGNWTEWSAIWAEIIHGSSTTEGFHAVLGNLSNGRFRGDGDLDRKLSHNPCITAHDLANFPAVAGTSATWRAGVCRCGENVSVSFLSWSFLWPLTNAIFWNVTFDFIVNIQVTF